MRTDDLSKQQRWQLKQYLNGNCVRCGKPSNDYKNCPSCREKRRKRYERSLSRKVKKAVA